METKYFWLQQKEKNQELRIEKIRGTVNPADLMTKHLDGKRLVLLCELLNIKRIDGRPSSTPKLTIDTEYISRASRASRALGAITLVKRATASEIAVAFWSHARNVDRWIQSRWLDSKWMDACRYCDLLHHDEFGTAVEENCENRRYGRR